MASKASFDSVTRIITLTEPPTLVGGEYVVELDVKTDLYSAGLADWAAMGALRKMRFPIRPVGGDPLPSGFLGSTFFLDSRWKIRPYEANHRLKITGNLYSEDGTSPLTQTLGARNVLMEMAVSSLVTQEGMSADVNTKLDLIQRQIASPLDVRRGQSFRYIHFPMFEWVADVVPKAGLKVCGFCLRDGGGWQALTNPVSDVGEGFYRAELTAAETDCETLTLRFVANTAKVFSFTVRPHQSGG